MTYNLWQKLYFCRKFLSWQMGFLVVKNNILPQISFMTKSNFFDKNVFVINNQILRDKHYPYMTCHRPQYKRRCNILSQMLGILRRLIIHNKMSFFFRLTFYFFFLLLKTISRHLLPTRWSLIYFCRK